MQVHVITIGAVTSSDILRYAAAFFFVIVALGIVYACVRVAKVLLRVDTVMADVDKEAIPLMQKAGVTLDNVNANLSNVDVITKDVADITDKMDAMANAVEGAVTTPARKAAAFGAGVQTAMSSFMRRERTAGSEQARDWPGQEDAASPGEGAGDGTSGPVTSAFTGTTFTPRGADQPPDEAREAREAPPTDKAST